MGQTREATAVCSSNGMNKIIKNKTDSWIVGLSLATPHSCSDVDTARSSGAGAARAGASMMVLK